MLGSKRTVKTCIAGSNGCCDRQSRHDRPKHTKTMKAKENREWKREAL